MAPPYNSIFAIYNRLTFFSFWLKMAQDLAKQVRVKKGMAVKKHHGLLGAPMCSLAVWPSKVWPYVPPGGVKSLRTAGYA